MYTNANSLSNKRNELQGRIHEVKPDIIGITEIWQMGDYCIQGYRPGIRHDRNNKRKGGGIMLLIRDSLEVTEVPELSESMFEESVWCMIHLSKKKKLLIGLCYRSPNSSTENNNQLNSLLHIINNVNASGILIMGDFNYRQIKWSDGIVESSDNSEAAKFFHATQDAFLYQQVHSPTRYREGCMPSVLDLVFTNEEHMVEDLICSEPFGKKRPLCPDMEAML